MSVPAENALGAPQSGVIDGAGSDFGREPQPAGIQAIQSAGEEFAFEIQLLQLQVNE